MQTVKINVTQRDIEKANAFRDKPEFNILCHCPVARAVSRLGVAKGKPVTWGYSEGTVYKGKETSGTVAYTLSAKDASDVANWVGTWDDRKRVEPFTFTATIEEGDR